jgi:NADH-quinone oxidoreductase subunit L
MAYTFYYWKKINADKVAEKIKPLYKFSLNKWYFDELYDKTVIAFTMIFAKFLRWFDNTIVDGVVNGSAYITKITSFFSGKFDNFVVDTIVNLAGAIAAVFGWFFRKLQTGKIQTYIAFLIFGMLILYFVFKVII